ncbi:zf-HC2 domain-containing protein [Micromonospora carbonacea]|uniref:Predicted anti-sigma-YlaC factor YlaD, contains Zn-finger domain n=1 Tax=Micromonospora carbonacea TaxID=47853 RepID=A0A1C5A0E0_9ACTN|nr:zf-HC2 domain-containing protein [Micromonospora carbonacea]SCF38722.1 Predicted anti-sigma-YlaC factor YlaD, contains Zn-finger domain [Micromonospora carbonacea]
MRCERWREMLSAQLDGEETPAERVAAEGHLITCGDCRAWFETAAAVTRRARTRVVTATPDLADAVLAAVAGGPPRRPRRWAQRWSAQRWRERLVAGLRATLGLVGAVQVVLGLVQVGRGTSVAHAHVTGQHLWHESAAWNVAVGAGFLFVAVRRFPPAGVLPMLSAFVATLVLLSVNDLVTGQVAVSRLVSHAILVFGWVLTALLSRPGLRPGGPAPRQGRSPGSRWRVELDGPEPSTPTLRLLPPHPYSAQAHVGRGAAVGGRGDRRAA